MLPQVQHKQRKQCLAPVTVFSTQAKSTSG